MHRIAHAFAVTREQPQRRRSADGELLLYFQHDESRDPHIGEHLVGDRTELVDSAEPILVNDLLSSTIGGERADRWLSKLFTFKLLFSKQTTGGCKICECHHLTAADML